MKVKLKLAGLFGFAAIAALIATATGASTAFGFSEFKAAGGGNPAGITFTGTGGVAKLESTGKNSITCEKSKSTGKIESSVLVHLTVTYEGKCAVKGVVNGTCETVTTKELSAAPSTIVGGSGRGLLFRPVSGTVMAVVKCPGVFGAETIEVAGGVICENPKPTPASMTGEVVCEQTGAGVQAFTEDEVAGSILKCDLTANALFTKEKDALTATLTLTFSSALEQT